MSAAFFIFQLVAGLSSSLVEQAANDPARQAFARILARDRTVEAAGQAIVFLIAQGLIQTLALIIASRIATRGLDAEFARMRLVIGEQEKRLEEAAALSGWKEVASFLSHQLKNPLASIALSGSNATAALALLESKEPSNREKAQAILTQSLDALGQETLRLTALIQRLKSLTAFEKPDFSLAQLAPLIAQLAQAYPPERAVFKLSGAAEARLDPELMRQVFRNLVENAIEEAEKQEGLPVKIDIALETAQNGCLIRLRDSNRLMSPELAAKLGKERFSTKRTGSGLGLIFVSRIMAIHGGLFTAQATSSGALEAILTLPPPREGI